MARIKSKHTKPELTVRNILRQLGVKYRLHSNTLPGKPDIVIYGNKKAIFINGCFWHQHDRCKRKSFPKSNMTYWINKLQRNVEKQKQDIRSLNLLGWDANIIWECQTKKKNIENRIRRLLNEQA